MAIIHIAVLQLCPGVCHPFILATLLVLATPAPPPFDPLDYPPLPTPLPPPPPLELSVSLAARRAKRFCVFNCLWRALFNGNCQTAGEEKRKRSRRKSRGLAEGVSEKEKRVRRKEKAERSRKKGKTKQKQKPDPGNRQEPEDGKRLWKTEIKKNFKKGTE